MSAQTKKDDGGTRLTEGAAVSGSASDQRPHDATIMALPKRQRDALIQIALNCDAVHHPRTLAALEQKGLIVGRDEVLGGRFPVTIRRFDTPLSVHIAVCEWCSTQEASGCSPETQG